MTNEELVTLIQAGEWDRLPELWDQVERFVAWNVRKLLVRMGPEMAASAGVEFGDLYNSGYLALAAALEAYTPDSGFLFTTYLGNCLKNTFAETTGFRTQRQKKDPLKSAGSMDAPVKASEGEDSATFGDFIPDPQAAQMLQDVEDGMQRAWTHKEVKQAIEQLPIEERLAIMRYYYEGRNRREAGKDLERAELHLRRLLLDKKEDMLT